MDYDDPYGETERPLDLPGGLPERREIGTERDLDKQLTRANVMARLFQSLVEPTRIGRFTLIKRLGAGGMGEVYAAYDEQLDRKVAIKVVLPDAEPGASQRLLREAQVLARLSHPNVVQVYEAGTVGDRVFLAMEFIRGKNLRQWLAEHDEVPEPTRWRSVLAMFLAAGRGLAAAHAAGLVHRDFKPDNVLVGDDQRVCVADFGLARVSPLEGAVSGNARDELVVMAGRPSTIPRPTDTLTRSGAQMGTPAYMSPEQWRGQPSDSRSDQFSFCVALCESLYRVHPFTSAAKDAAKDVDDRRPRLRERVLAGDYQKPPETTPVPARIWAILQRGLAVAPEDRYPDMDTLLDALAADPARAWRRRMIAALLLSAGALAGGGIAFHAASQSPSDPCALAGVSVQTLWNPEIAAQARAAFVATGVPYAQDMWSILEPRIAAYATELEAGRKASCEATHVRREQSVQLFDLEGVCLDRRERHLAALRDQLVHADAVAVERSANAVAALPRIETCSDSESLVLGVQPPDEHERAAVQAIQSQLAKARMQQVSGHHAQALALAQAQLQAVESVAYRPVRAEALQQMGTLWLDSGSKDDIARAEEALKQALDLAESQRHDELVNEIWLDLLLLARRHHSELAWGREWARRALATSDRLGDPGQQRQQRARALGFLGAIDLRQGDAERAEQNQREALRLVTEPPGGPLLLRADLMQDLANTLAKRGKAAEARTAYEEALGIYQAELSEGHPRIAALSYDMAWFLRETGNVEQARALFGQAQAIWTAIYGPVHLDVADVHLALAGLERGIGNLDKAEEHARTGRDIYGQVVAPDSPHQAKPETSMALIAFRQRRFTEALEGFERALAIQQRTSANSTVAIAMSQSSIGETLVELGRPDEALARFAEAEATLARTGTALPIFTAMPLKGRGLALLAKGQPRAAIQPLERALGLLSGQDGYPLELADVEWALARALRALGQSGGADTRARALAESARQRYRTSGRAALHEVQKIDIWLGHE